MINGAEIIVKCLQKENTEVVFGYPGAAVLPLYNALTQSDIKNILVRFEQNAGHAASGYARISGKPGVCIATSGPGATNLITAIACAYMDSIPLVAITGQVRSDLLGRDVFQEVDITGACEPFTKHSYICMDTAQLPKIIKQAFHIASTGRKGPVLIDIPVDIQENELEDFCYEEKVEIAGYKPSVNGHLRQIKNAVLALEQAQRPVICAGGGAISSGAGDLIRTISLACDIPVVTTMMGQSLMCNKDENYLGMLGNCGKKAANTAIKNADVIMICGGRVGDRAVAAPDQVSKQATIIHIDVDPAEIGKNLTTKIPIVGDLNCVLTAITEQMPKVKHTKWLEQCKAQVTQTEYDEKDKGFVDPKLFINKLTSALEDNAVIVADVGQNQIWAADNSVFKCGTRFLTSGGLGAMGYSVPAAIGAKIADNSRQVVAICGDGAFQMQMMELSTVVKTNSDIKIIIMNNQCLGMVYELQPQNSEFTKLSCNPDFTALAKAYGINAKSITENSQIDAAIQWLMNTDGAAVLECAVDPTETSMGERE